MAPSLSKPLDSHSELPHGLLEQFQLVGPALPLAPQGGFSGARFWVLQDHEQKWVVRRWPKGEPTQEQLHWIHRVLDHARQNGFQCLPPQRRTTKGTNFCMLQGAAWEVSGWMAGTPLELDSAGEEGLAAAMTALAGFHLAVADFPMPAGQTRQAPPPTVKRRVEYLGALVRGRADRIRRELERSSWSELGSLGVRVLSRWDQQRHLLEAQLQQVDDQNLICQPCLRDIWYRNLLMVDRRVSSLLDFGSMGVDSVATDVARLLGSLTRPGSELWRRGLDSYLAVRGCSPAELQLVSVIECANWCMSGMKWLDWILLEKREFADPAEVLSRLEELSG